MSLARTVHAEWTKLRTTPSTGWLAVAAVGVTVAVSVLATVSVDPALCPTEATCQEDPPRVALFGVRIGQALFLVLGVLAMGNEYGTRMIQTTLTAVPRRLTLVAAKLATVVAFTAIPAALAVAGSWAAWSAVNGWALLPRDEPTWRAVAGSVLYLVLVALLGLGVGAIVRETAAGITIVTALLYFAPLMLTLIKNPLWQWRIQRYAPMNAGLAVQATRDLAALPITPWLGLGVLAAYAGAAVLLAAALVKWRDIE